MCVIHMMLALILSEVTEEEWIWATVFRPGLVSELQVFISVSVLVSNLQMTPVLAGYNLVTKIQTV
jgi:hypothetical protein